MDLDELKAIIKGLSVQDRQALLADLKDDAGRPADTAEAIDALEERRFSNGRFANANSTGPVTAEELEDVPF